MSIEIDYLTTPMTLSSDVNIPIVVREKCPRCMQVVEKDLTKVLLQNPVVNQIFDLDLEHDITHPCQYKWQVKMIMRIGLVQAQPAVFTGWTDPKSKVQVIKTLRLLTGCTLLDGKKWVESKPHGISRELAEGLEASGGIIEWRYR